ncbi:MAG: TolC family protein [Candidatus Eiseniibacteriota bacterium]|nr:MAG: TolC family protein [Candidatus Eisenbacteria bacterium]
MTLALAVALVVLAWTYYGTALAGERSDAKRRARSVGAMLESERRADLTFDSTATVEDYLALAMERSPALRAAYNRWVAALRNSDHAGALPDPVFSYGYFLESIETRVGPQEQRFGLRQAFSWFGTLGAKRDMSFAASEAAFQKFESERLKLFYQVKVAYYDYYFIGQDLSITRENLELLKFWESVVRSKYKVGLKQHPDLIKVQVELGKLEVHLRTLEEKTEPAAARMRALLNLQENEPIPVPSVVTVEEAALQEELVIAAVKLNNPDLRALSHLVEREEAGVRLAKKLSMPSFSVGVDYIQTGEALNPDMPEGGKDPWMVGASVTLPLWLGKNSARTAEATARREAAKYGALDAENRLAAATEKVLFEYSDALRKTKLYRDGLVPKAQQSLNSSYAAYQAGETDFLNVLDAQRQLLDFQLTVAREKTRLATKRAELEMLTGSEIGDDLLGE